MLTRDAVITVLPFTQQREGDDIIIGRVETGVFLAVPPEAVEILDSLSKGHTVGAVTDSYNLKYGEIPDLEDLITFLEAKGIVSTSTIEKHGENVAGTGKPGVRHAHYHFSTFPQSIAQRIFGETALFFCLALFVSAGFLCIKHPELFPRARDLYFPDYRTISWVILLLVNYTTLFVHEFAHLVAARALGVNSRLGISHRLWYLVAETDLTGLWSVPKEKRYLPMLAGVIVDMTCLSGLILIIYGTGFHWHVFPEHVVRVMRAMAFTYLMRLAWQCLLYVRTDFYYVIAAFFNCKSLMRDTEAFLRNLLAKLLPRIRKVDQSSIPIGERRIIRAYALLWVAGRVGAVALLCAVTIPIGILYIRSLANAFRTGFSTNPSNFVDAVLLAAYFLIPTGAGFILWFRSILRQEKA